MIESLATSARQEVELLERDGSLAALTGALETLRATSEGRLVLLSGEAGVGKTALLRRFREQLDPSQRLLWGGCDPLFAPRPLGPLIAVADDVGGELAKVVSLGAIPHEVVAVLARALRSPTVFVLEDVHWADEATLDVLRLLVRRIETVPVLIVASYRDDELDRRHPLRVMLGELATNVAVTRLRIDPLSPSAVEQLAEPHGVDAGELYRKTLGNPFFVAEVLSATDAGIPDTVRDAVLARAAPLSAKARRLLDAVAVVPVQAELPLLQALAGDGIEGLEECLRCGVLAAEPTGVAFRHELARLAFEESIPPHRKVELHQTALAWLAGKKRPAADLARLAHHAEACGDADAVVRYAPAAAEHATVLGAHREAAAQYARALRFGDQLTEDERAKLLEQRAHACYLTDHYDDGIAALQEALGYRHALGQTLQEGDALRRLSEFMWCPGRTDEAERLAQEAVARLEALPPGRELAHAYANLAFIDAAAVRGEPALRSARRALDLAEAHDDTEVAVWALLTTGACQADYSLMDESLMRSQEAGLIEAEGRAHAVRAHIARENHLQSLAGSYIDAGIACCSERGLELFRTYLLVYRAQLELEQGRWSSAAESASAVLQTSRSSINPRILALVVLGLVRARRGDPGVWPLLDEAQALGSPTHELPRIAPVAAARAEAAWLEGRPEVVAEETGAAFELAVLRGAAWWVGELAAWRRRAGLEDRVDLEVAAPYALELAGRAQDAATAWAELGCPYESALALAQADAQRPLRRALAELQRLEARPAAAVVTRRLRERGARDLPRGPRQATRANPAGLTPREAEVLACIAAGLRNAEIALRLFVSEKTVEHHVSAILRKLGVSTRGRAAAQATQLGLVVTDG